MKKTFKLYKSLVALALVAITVLGCDRDFTSIESDIEGIKNFNTTSKKFPIVAFNRQINAVQTNNLSSNLLGIYNDGVYGATSSSIVTQVTLDAYGVDYGDSPEVESVILTIPYFSSSDGTDEDGNNLYKIDSLFGDDPVKISIYQNTYFLRDLDPNTNLEESQKYYSNANQTINFDASIGELLYEDLSFYPNNAEIVIEEINEETGESEVVNRLSPGLRVELLNTTEFWDDLFFFNDPVQITHSELSNSNNFKNYFRGLYFKVESLSDNGNMIMLPVSLGNIVINYTALSNEVDEVGNPLDTRNDRVINMRFSGNRLNILENDPSNMVITNADINADPVNGDESLYLKGGEGSMAVLDLFNGMIQDEETGTDIPALDYFRSKKNKWLINEANLVFSVNQNLISNNTQEPERVILYDLNNNFPIIDYFFDTSTNNSNPLNSKINFSNQLVREENGDGVRYKLRLTEHISNILLKDSTNVKLGLLVTTNINEIQNADILGTDYMSTTGSVLSPRGTVLYGSNPSVPDDKKVTFEIYYTEPNN